MIWLSVKRINTIYLSGITVNWQDSNAIYVRWNIKAHVSSSTSKHVNLILEAIPMKKGDFEAMAPEAKDIICGGAVKTFKLWAADGTWHAPLKKLSLCTTPGILSRDGPQMTDPLVRWHVN